MKQCIIGPNGEFGVTASSHSGAAPRRIALLRQSNVLARLRRAIGREKVCGCRVGRLAMHPVHYLFRLLAGAPANDASLSPRHHQGVRIREWLRIRNPDCFPANMRRRSRRHVITVSIRGMGTRSRTIPSRSGGRSRRGRFGWSPDDFRAPAAWVARMPVNGRPLAQAGRKGVLRIGVGDLLPGCRRAKGAICAIGREVTQEQAGGAELGFACFLSKAATRNPSAGFP